MDDLFKNYLRRQQMKIDLNERKIEHYKNELEYESDEFLNSIAIYLSEKLGISFIVYGNSVTFHNDDTQEYCSVDFEDNRVCFSNGLDNKPIIVEKIRELVQYLNELKG